MRILHIIAGAQTGGAETFAQDAITALAAQGVEQRIVMRPHPLPLARFAEAGIPVEPLQFSRIDRWLGARRRIRALAAGFNADAVHAWMARAISFVPSGMPCPVIGWFGGPYDLKYYRSADFFVGVTHDIARHIVASGGGVNRTFVVHTFGTLPDAPPIRRAALDTPEDAPVLLTLSRLHPKKGIDTLLEALVAVPGAYLWIAGDGPDRATYERLAERLGLSARVRFLGWRTDRRALLEAADICVLPSRYEPFGTVIVEAWSMQRPLVATLADGARQYVRDGSDGLLCPIDDVAALADRIAHLVDDPSLRAQLAANGYDSYRRTFQRDVVIARLIETYRRVVQIGPRAAAASVPAREVDQALVDRLAADLTGTESDPTRVRDAVEAAVAHASDGGASRDQGRAVDAALLALSGQHWFADGAGARRRIAIWKPAEFDIAAETVDLPALRLRHAAFAGALGDRLRRRSAA
jgi:glycosyltransferase involved in cell wall biosynthesis